MLEIDIDITDPIVLWVVRHASWLLNPYRSQTRRLHALQMPLGREAVELGEQVYWTVQGLTQQKFEDRRLGTWLGKTERLDETACRWSAHCQIQTKWTYAALSYTQMKELVDTPWDIMPKSTKLMGPMFLRR